MKIRIVFLVIALFAFMLLNVTPWARRVEAQTFFGAQRAPAIEVDKDDNIFLFMSVATKPAGAGTPGSQIFFTQSRDGGATWDNFPLTRNLSKSRGEAFGPSAAINKNGKTRAYVVYHDNSNGGLTQAHMIRSKKNAKFKGARNITPGNDGSFYPRTALDSNETVFVVWGETRNFGKQVILVRSTDQGETFGEPLNISNSAGEAFEPEIAVDFNNTINVAWQDTAPGISAIMFARSADGGRTFSLPKRVSRGPAGATEAHIAIDSSNRIHIVWVDGGENDSQPFYARSTDGGQTFSDPINLSKDPGAEIHKPFVATFKDTVYVAYHDEGGRNKQVFLVKSEDAGLNFSAPVQVSQADNSTGRGHSPAIVVDSKGRLHLVYIDSSIVGRDEGILFYRNTTNGRIFSPQLTILALL